ncbi:TetR family transcriptional regulator [Saccharothrix sp. NRRL B-16348]|uniref:TetR/AcrR family transcriptional regulator n=1 Tax=Saccharothrix sp. NRRL B-16348 TaxID=1415542 RepID=UPI0006AE32DA|nr:TetR/AcrR family transcriptional regulator [Saccharothrix sp. NRRL B-16348]KOX24762.1 TetR family transcriptional regulator [Saccharothrix sp. NRRL B-16348]
MSTDTGQRDTGQRETRRQADRSRETRRKLMEATVECLVERGWAGTTTTVVAERAGVSRGAQLHHFRTRGELVAAAVEYLGAESVLDLKERARQVNGSTVAVVELIADFYASDLFTAALELWVAARTDPDLKTVVVPLEVRLGRETHRLAVELLDADETKPGVRETVQLTLDLVRGLALANQLTDDGRRRSRIVRHWARVLEELLEGQAP